jgi:hypothetical protein
MASTVGFTSTPDADINVRTALWKRPDLPSEIWSLLTEESSPSVRGTAVTNASIPESVLRTLLDDPVPMVRYHALNALEPTLTWDQLGAFARSRYSATVEDALTMGWSRNYYHPSGKWVAVQKKLCDELHRRGLKPKAVYCS